MFFAAATPAPRRRPAARPRRRPTGGPSFDDILADMGIDGASRRATAARHGAAGRPGRSASAPAATAEAVAEITLEEAFHGTTRLVEVDGKRLEVTIPRGVDTGSRIKLTGKGPGGGDLVVVVPVRPHPVFSRHGADLERELPLTLAEALLGARGPRRRR